MKWVRQRCHEAPAKTDVDSQLGRAAFAVAGRPVVCQNDRHGFGLPLDVEPGRVRDVGQHCPGNPEALPMGWAASTVG